MAKEAVLSQSVKAALDAETDAELSAEVCETAIRVTFLVPQVATAAG